MEDVDNSFDIIHGELKQLKCELDPDWTLDRGRRGGRSRPEEAFNDGQDVEAASGNDDSTESDEEGNAMSVPVDDMRNV